MEKTVYVPLDVVIMAAGKGTRMKSALPKVLHRLGGKALLAHVIATAAQLKARSAIVITGGEGVEGLARFQQDLKITMMKAGVGVRHASRFTTHLTIMYTDPIDEFSIQPISWKVNEFVLVDSLVGQSKHVLLGRWSS